MLYCVVGVELGWRAKSHRCAQSLQGKGHSTMGAHNGHLDSDGRLNDNDSPQDAGHSCYQPPKKSFCPSITIEVKRVIP